MKSAKRTHCSWHLPNKAHGPTTAGAHPRKAGDKPGDPLLSAGVSTTPSKALPPALVRAVVRWLGKAKTPEVGPHPEGLRLTLERQILHPRV